MDCRVEISVKVERMLGRSMQMCKEVSSHA